ncbi:siderophore-interacting protein [Dactylosporangium cerinum]
MTFEFFDVTVLRRELLSPSAVRIVFGGPDRLVSGGRDQRFKLFLPQPHQSAAVVPRGSDWYAEWRAADPSTRAVMRTYTVREQRDGEFDVEFAVHDTVAAGPASTWARHARPGDRAVVLCPTVADNGGVDFRPPPDTEWVLLTGDETAVPALAGILDWVGSSLPVRAWIEVHDPVDVRDLPRADSVEVTWLVGGGTVEAVRAAELPSGTPYAWLAGSPAWCAACAGTWCRSAASTSGG